MTDLNLKNSRKIIKLVGLPERPELSVLGHQARGNIIVPLANFVAAYSFDDTDTSGSTLTCGVSGGVHNATLLNSPTTGEVGQVAESYLFNGTTQSCQIAVTASDDLNFTTDTACSLQAWVKTTDFSDSILIGRYEFTGGAGTWGWALGHDEGRPYFLFSSADGTEAIHVRSSPGNRVDDNEWHHILVTFDGSHSANGLKLYIDSSQDSLIVQDNAGTWTGTGVDAYLARRVDGAYLGGNLDEVYAFNIELTEDQIVSCYQLGLTGAKLF